MIEFTETERRVTDPYAWAVAVTTAELIAARPWSSLGRLWDAGWPDDDEECSDNDASERYCNCSNPICTLCGDWDDVHGYAAILTDLTTGDAIVRYIDDNYSQLYNVERDLLTAAQPRQVSCDIIAVRLSPRQIRDINHRNCSLGLRVHLTVGMRGINDPKCLWVCPWTIEDERIAKSHGLTIESVARARRCHMPISELIVSHNHDHSLEGHKSEAYPELAG